MPRASPRARIVIQEPAALSSVQRDFAAAVYEKVCTIPSGRVSTYGHIAKMLGYPRHSRMVGASLKMLPIARSIPPREDRPNPDFVPWHRVINARGTISPRGSVRALERQATLLREEGVEVRDPQAGYGGDDPSGMMVADGGRVSLTIYGWFP